MGQLAFFWKDFVAILWRVQCTLDVQTLDRQGHEGHGALMVNDGRIEVLLEMFAFVAFGTSKA